MSIELRILYALWFILPAYVANSVPVNVSKIREFDFLGKPIDGGRKWKGARIFGDGKTWRGLIAGVFAGTVVGFLQYIFQSDANIFFSNLLRSKDVLLPQMSLELAFMLSAGALFGDMVASFVKRRTGLERGDPAPLLDQLDFVFGAFFFAWLLNRAYLDYDRFFVVVVITPGIHLFSNFIAWFWKLKRDPW